jgi:hypothetical protein
MPHQIESDQNRQDIAHHQLNSRVAVLSVEHVPRTDVNLVKPMSRKFRPFAETTPHCFGHGT